MEKLNDVNSFNMTSDLLDSVTKKLNVNKHEFIVNDDQTMEKKDDLTEEEIIADSKLDNNYKEKRSLMR
jgi:hypothetical protein